MKQFNLDEYLASPTKRLITRDGRKVRRILCTDVRGMYPVAALVEYCEDTDCAYTYTKDGRFHISGPCDEDLFFAPEKHEGWATIYGKFLTGEIFSTKEEAEESVKRCGTKDFVAIAKVEWEE